MYLSQTNSTFQETQNSSWRAMIIKDQIGDWAICSASWVGMKKGGVRIGRYYQRGNPGQFMASVRYLRGPPKTHAVSMDIGLHTHIKSAFSVGISPKMLIYPKNAQIKLDSNEAEPFHKIALTYTLSTLYLLVQPRPETIPSTPTGRRVSVYQRLIGYRKT